MSSYTTDVSTRAHAQWVIIIINNSGSQDIKLANLKLEWGKLHADGDKDKELQPSAYNNQIIHPGDKLQFNACGREGAPAGTEGGFDLVDAANGKKIRHFYWDCPWSKTSNTWTVNGSNAKWFVDATGANLSGGALGTITIDVLNKPGAKAYV